MRNLLIVILLAGLSLTGKSQVSLAIDLYRFGHFKRLHIYPNEPIVYKLRGSNTLRHDVFLGGRDSVLYMGSGDAVKLSEIKKIVVDRSNWLVRKLYKTGIRGGIFIMAIDAANNIGNNRPTIVDTPFIEAGAAMIVTGFTIKYLSRRHLHPGENTRLQIIDLSLH